MDTAQGFSRGPSVNETKTIANSVYGMLVDIQTIYFTSHCIRDDLHRLQSKYLILSSQNNGRHRQSGGLSLLDLDGEEPFSLPEQVHDLNLACKDRCQRSGMQRP